MVVTPIPSEAARRVKHAPHRLRPLSARVLTDGTYVLLAVHRLEWAVKPRFGWP